MNYRRTAVIAIILIAALMAAASLPAGAAEPKSIATIKAIRLAVTQNYGNAKNVGQPFASLARSFLKAAGFEVVEETARSVDAVLEIVARGEAIAATYMPAGTRYAGAKLTGTVTLSMGKESLYNWTFLGETPPAKVISGAAYRTPDNAPFRLTFEKTGYHLALPDMLWEVFGSSRRDVIVSGFIAGQKSPDDVYFVCGLCHTLGRIGDPRAKEPLLRMVLEHGYAECRSEAAKALKLLDPVWTRDALLRELASTETGRRGNAINAIDVLRDPATVPALIDRLLKDPNHEWVRQVAARALGNLGGTAAVEALIKALLQEQNATVRMVAADSLGQIGDRRAREALIKASTSDSDAGVRLAAKQALEKIG